MIGVCSAAPVDAQVTQTAFVPGDNNGRVGSVQVPTMAPGTLELVGPNPRSVAVSLDGRRLYVANYGGATGVIVYDLPGFSYVTTIANTGSSYGLAISPDNRWLYVTLHALQMVAVVDLNDHSVAATIPVANSPTAVQLNSAGTYLYVSNESSESVSVIDTATRIVVATIPIGGSGTSLAISPDGTRGYVSLTWGSTSQRVRVLDLVANTPGLTIDFTGVVVASVAFSRDGSYVFMTGLNTGLIYVVDTLTNTVVDTEPVPSGAPHAISVSADGSRFYVVTTNGDIAQYDANTRLQIGPPVGLGVIGSEVLGSFLSPPAITSGTLPITSDADLDAPGFGTWVNFNGGTLQVNGNWSTARTISVLQGGGTIDTNGWDLTLPTTINGGVLTKSGTGLLTITTPGHTGGTTITAGGLLLAGGTTHSAPITVQGGTLHGSGTAGSIAVNSGAIQPGTPGVGNTAILQATGVTFSGGSFVVDITGDTAGSGYDQLVVSGPSALGAGAATLTVRLLYVPINGTSFTILTNATGQFQGLPEGGTFAVGAENFRITYQGGDGNDVVLTADDVPSASAIGPQTIVENRVLGPLSLTVGDDLTPAGSLVVTASSSNTAVVEDNDIVIGGSGTSRDITVTPVALANGQTTITVNVSDGYNTTPVTFLLTVTPDNDPTITAPANASMTRGTVRGPLAFTIGDDLTAAASLTVTATSSNHAVVKDEDVAIGGTGASRTLTITSEELATGLTTITLTVLDEFDQSTPATFTVNVLLDGPPTIAGQTLATTTRDTVLGPLAFTIGDDVVAPAALTFTASSSNAAVVRNQDITLGGSGAARTLTVTPVTHASGSTIITLSVFDGLQTTTHPLALTVTMDGAPTIIGPGNHQYYVGDPIAPIPVMINDDLIAPAALTLTATSSNVALVRNEDLGLGGSGRDRTLTIAPLPEAFGTTTITMSVSDGVHTTPHVFTLTIKRDEPPTVTGIGKRTTWRDTVLGPLAFVVFDDRLLLPQMTISAVSSNQAVVRDQDVVFSGLDGASGPPRLTITPVAGALGTTTITLSVADARSTATHAFVVEVVEPMRRYYLTEGATGSFFDTDLLLANPNDVAVPVSIEFLRAEGDVVTVTRELLPTSRTTIRMDEIVELEAAEVSTIVSSTTGLPIVVERTMRWDASGYGSHTEKATEDGPGLSWYFAEGSQNAFFKTYFLLANPGDEANVAYVTYIREGEPSLTVEYQLAPASRYTIDAGTEPGLDGRAFGAIVFFELPGLAERAMYFGGSPLFTGGHVSAGAASPAYTWFLAEGATGSYFSTYVLLANPGTDPAEATVTFLPDAGEPVTKVYTVPGQRRLTLDIAQQDPALAGAGVGARVDSDRPIVVERSQYWPNGAWHEAHNSGGVTAPGERWGLAEGRVGGPTSDQTFILFANPGTEPATVTVRFLRTDGTTVTKTVPVAATSRVTVSVGGAGSDVPELIDESFGAVIDSTQPIVVERSMYSTVNGVSWAAGTNATATRLP